MGEESPFKSQPIAFSKKVWQGRKQQYQNPKFLGISGTKPFVFFDRGLHDVVAYLDYIVAPYDSQKFDLSDFPYDLAILLPPWKKIYKKDSERHENFEEAEYNFMNALDENPDDIEAVMGMAQVFENAEKWRKAEKFYRELIAIDPENPEHYRGMSRVKLQQGEPDQSKRFLDKAKDLGG